MVTIRLARREDCAACCKMSRIAELAIADGSFISEEYFEIMIDDDELFFVAEEDGKIVGYVLGEPMKGKLAFLSLLCVDASLRGKGAGKLLLARFEEQCLTKGLRIIVFYAPLFNENTIGFYNKQEYVQGKDHAQFMKILN